MWLDPPPRRSDPWRDPGDDDSGWPDLNDYYGLKSEQFIITPNPEVGRLYLPDGEIVTIYERDDRFGFERWVESPEEYD